MAATLASTIIAPSITCPATCSPSNIAAIAMATGGIKYIATDARLTSTCFNT